MLSLNMGLTENSPAWGSIVRRGGGGMSRMKRMQAAWSLLDRDLDVQVVVVQEAGHMIDEGSPYAEAAVRSVTPAFSWVRTGSFLCGTRIGGQYARRRQVATCSSLNWKIAAKDTWLS